MFCPRCKCEYREGFDTCADCGVALVEALPQEPEPSNDGEAPVVVFESTDPAEIALAQSVLRSANVEFAVEQEGLQDLFGAGRVGGVSPLVGPSRIVVREPDAKAAKALLQESDLAR